MLMAIGAGDDPDEVHGIKKGSLKAFQFFSGHSPQLFFQRVQEFPANALAAPFRLNGHKGHIALGSLLVQASGCEAAILALHNGNCPDAVLSMQKEAFKCRLCIKTLVEHLAIICTAVE